MPYSFTSKPTATYSLTWEQATMTWNEATHTWDSAPAFLTKPSASYSFVSKPTFASGGIVAGNPFGPWLWLTYSASIGGVTDPYTLTSKPS